jgi:hypothetical protein
MRFTKLTYLLYFHKQFKELFIFENYFLILKKLSIFKR